MMRAIRRWRRRRAGLVAAQYGNPDPGIPQHVLWAAPRHLTRAWSATGSRQLSCLDLAANVVSDGARVASSASRSITPRGLTTQTIVALRA